MLYILYKYLIVFNDFRNEMLLLEMLQDGEDSHLDYVEKAIHNRNYTTYDFRAVGETTSTLTDEEHKANIRKGIATVCAVMFSKSSFHAVLSNVTKEMISNFTCFTQHQPSPYLFYFDFGASYFRFLSRDPL